MGNRRESVVLNWRDAMSERSAIAECCGRSSGNAASAKDGACRETGVLDVVLEPPRGGVVCAAPWAPQSLASSNAVTEELVAPLFVGLPAALVAVLAVAA